MKHIFRKNQIIVTALALMIAAAGYVNYTYNMSEEDLASKAVDGEEDTMETAATTLSEDEIFTDTEADADGTDAGAEGEADMGDEDAGETVLTGSDSVSIDRAAELKLNREQTRAANKASLTEVINNAALTEGEKTAAVEELAKISDISERESACELLLQSKGFDEAVVSITDDSADVIVNMAEITLQKMYAGGLFDHIGYGFCRYSTDRYYLVPHFEKMLYDNALLILAYCKAYELTGESFYLEVAKKTASYILDEMTSPKGGFYSAQDADSDGEEGKYYVFTPEEIIELLGQADGTAFCERFGITKTGNFEGKSIPNLLHAKDLTDERFDCFLPTLRDYRRGRTRLHTDDKILTAWNALMIAALCRLYRCSRDHRYLEAAKKAQGFIENSLFSQDTLYVSFRDGKLGEHGFLDDYAGYIFALLSLYDATLEETFLRRAMQLTRETVTQYYDSEHGGFYLSGRDNETLLFRPKECYDGALPSGNSLIAYVLVCLNALLPDYSTENILNKQLAYMAGEAEQYPAGFSMFLMALSDFLAPPLLVTVVSNGEDLSDLPFVLPSDAIVKVLERPLQEYKLLNNETTFYVCRKCSCLPPMNKRQFMMEILKQDKI